MGTVRRLLDGLAANMTATAVAVVFWVLTVALLGVTLIGVYAWTEGSVSIFVIGTLLALATAGVTGIAGFLFGLPRYTSIVAVSASTDGGTTANVARGANSTSSVFTPSNNLEQVSDWLTKLLLGVGLVQLNNVGRWLGRFLDGVAPSLTVHIPTPTSARVVAGSILALYSVLGFLFVYLSTTLWYRRRLQDIESPPRAE